MAVDQGLKTERKFAPIDRELAGRIADAVGASENCYLVTIHLDWRTGGGFRIFTESHMTDEQGQLLLETLETLPRKPEPPDIVVVKEGQVKVDRDHWRPQDGQVRLGNKGSDTV